IPEMSKLNSFTFEEKNLRLHRFRDIGFGKKYSYKKMQPNDARLVVKGSGGTTSQETFWTKLGDPKYLEKHDNSNEEDGNDHLICEKKESKKCTWKRPKPESTLFRCPIETCSKEYLYEKNLEKHMEVGVHERRPEKMNVQDYTLQRLAANLELFFSIFFQEYVYINVFFLYRTGSKTDAREAEKLMRQAKDDNEDNLFQPSDLLTSRQIAGVYKGFKKTKLDKRDRTRTNRVEPGGSRAKRSDDPELDEVNALFDTEGDPELEWETEPLFDETEDYRIAIREAHNQLFEGDECDEVIKRGWLGAPKNDLYCFT
ncbi:hypothetical protein PENTCL1PPCAC_15815, partial [Pristionchus entomophagus]